MTDQRRIAILTEALRVYDAAAEKFIGKVMSGRARSVETYNELEFARHKSREAQRDAVISHEDLC